MIDHIAAVIWIVVVGLATLVGPLCARQQRIAAGLRGRAPIVFPAAPGVAGYRVEEIALKPRSAAIEADPDLRDGGVARPGRTENGVARTGSGPLVYPRAGDLRLQLHFA